MNSRSFIQLALIAAAVSSCASPGRLFRDDALRQIAIQPASNEKAMYHLRIFMVSDDTIRLGGADVSADSVSQLSSITNMRPALVQIDLRRYPEVSNAAVRQMVARLTSMGIWRIMLGIEYDDHNPSHVCLRNLPLVESGIEEYRLDTGTYPQTLQEMFQHLVRNQIGKVRSCPSGGVYELDVTNHTVRCSIHGLAPRWD